MKKIILIFLSINFVYLFPQPTHKIMTYNALNYPGSTAAVRNPYFATVISNANPDILVMQEMTSQMGVNGFLTNVLIPINSNYTAGTFLNGPDTDNAIFFKSNLFSFISNTVIPTTLRPQNSIFSPFSKESVPNSFRDRVKFFTQRISNQRSKKAV